jgi:fatty-acid desaturase
VAFVFLFNNLTFLNIAFVLAGWILIGGYGIAIGYHRLFSHRSFKTQPWIEKILALLGVFAGQGSSLFWVAVHRGLHYPFSDTERDLHSPIHGNFHAYVGWQMYLDARKVTFKKCADLLSDPWHVFIHKNYNRIFWGTIIAMLLINWRISLFMIVIPSFISMHTENCVDLFCHTKKIGYRNHATADNSTNIWFLGYFGFGQGWHNNHHHDPSSAVYSSKWWELDFTRVLIFPIKKKTSLNVQVLS